MKCSVSAAEFKKLLKSVTSIYDYAKENPDTEGLGVLSVEEDGLWIEYGSAGAYIRKRAESKVLREGMTSVDLKAIQKLKLSGDVVIDAPAKTANITIYVGKKDKYVLPKVQTPKELIQAFRPDIDDSIKPAVVIPTHMVKMAASCISYKGNAENARIKLQVAFKKTAKGKKPIFSIGANDDYSFARYVVKSKSVKVSRSIKFILFSSLLKDILQEVDSAQKLKVWDVDGADEETSLVRFATDGFDFCHPVMSGESFDDLEQGSKEARTGTMEGSFVSDHKTLKTAFDSVSVFGSSSHPVPVGIYVSKKGVTFKTNSDGREATTSIEADDIRVPKKKKFVALFNSGYFGEFIRVLPKTLPVRIETWENFMRIVAENLEDGMVEYVVAQDDSGD